MVFAAGKPIRIYGTGKGTVRINFIGQKKLLRSSTDTWICELSPMEYGGPYSMEIYLDDEKTVLEDIYIGEVYLMSGQSNMEFKLKESSADKSVCRSNNFLRLFATDKIGGGEYYSSDDGWVVCEKEHAGEWSAISYFVGNRITTEKDIAVGVIACYHGASVIESWVPVGAFEKININLPIEEKFRDHVSEKYKIWNGDGKLYSSALSQVTPFSISAVVWYQGESDSSAAEGAVYEQELCRLIEIWRNTFIDEKLPFVVVQLHDYVRCSDPDGWSLVRKAQEAISSKVFGVTTVVSADVCENDCIHPPTKDKLAERIAKALI